MSVFNIALFSSNLGFDGFCHSFMSEWSCQNVNWPSFTMVIYVLCECKQNLSDVKILWKYLNAVLVFLDFTVMFLDLCCFILAVILSLLLCTTSVIEHHIQYSTVASM